MRQLTIDKNSSRRIVSATDAQINEFQAHVGWKLPSSFVAFLKTYNGGSFLECVYMPTQIGPLVVAQFLSLDKDDEYSLYRLFDGTRGMMPKKQFPFAEDPGGNLFLLSADGKVHFCNHEDDLILPICEEFNEFLQRLKSE